MTAYYALLESCLQYGIPVWGGSSDDNIQQILIIQKKTIRILARLSTIAPLLYDLETIIHWANQKASEIKMNIVTTQDICKILIYHNKGPIPMVNNQHMEV